MRVLVNAVSAKMGGAVNYIRELAREVAARRAGDEFVFLMPHGLVEALRRQHPELRFMARQEAYGGFWRRLWFDQVELRRIVRDERIDVLFSTANVGMLRPPCPQVLLVRNSLHFNRFYQQRILAGKGLRARALDGLRRRLICASVKSADVVMTPSATMLAELREFVVVQRGIANHYGVDHARFAPPAPMADAFSTAEDNGALLFTSLYSEHKNIGTLLEAVERINRDGIRCRLVTTCDPAWEGAGINPSALRLQEMRLAARLMEKELVEFTGVLTGDDMAAVYRCGSIFVYPSVVESFGHSLVEAMAAGLTIVAADVPINRELCADAALYFSPFDAGECAASIERVIQDSALRRDLAERSRLRAQSFRWEAHFDVLFEALAGATGRNDKSAERPSYTASV